LILYFDTFITDKSLVKWAELDVLLDDVRNSNTNYRRQSKIDIVKYTLSSYSVINWSNILIRFEIDDDLLVDDFSSFVRNLFPDAKIEFQRSTNQNQYLVAIDYFKLLDEKWIFYAPNNDHPFISSDIIYLEKIVKEADLLVDKLNSNYFSITYSHYSELMNTCKNNWMYSDQFQIYSETEDYFLLKYPKGYLVAISIVHIDLFETWFKSYDYSDLRIVRTEDIMKYEHPEQFVLIPKLEICRHYDSYAHTTLLYNDLRAIPFNVVPPLFIPMGFFDKQIKLISNNIIYKDGWVNCNEFAEKFSFEDYSLGTDIKLSIDQIPLFWRDKISEICILNESKSKISTSMGTIQNPILAYPKYLVLFYRIMYLATKIFRKIYK
jgi:hypothetical protein